MKAYRIAGVVVAASSALLLNTAPAGAATAPPRNLIVANNGVFGYAAIPKHGGATAFKYVEATFVVPPQNGGCYDFEDGAASLLGVGLGGSSAAGGIASGNAATAGVVEQCNVEGGYPYYVYASGSPESFPVNPGDVVVAGVYYNKSTKDYTYNIDDETSDQSLVTTTLGCGEPTCGTGSAEVVTTEGFNCFLIAPFWGVKVTDSAGVSGGIADTAWQGMVGAPTQPTATDPAYTSQLYSSTSPAESSFQVYGNSGGCQP